MTSACERCQSAGWICEEHQSKPFPHDDCAGPDEPCPMCNFYIGRPRLQEGLSIASTADAPNVAFTAPNQPPRPARQAVKDERLFEFLRGHDRFLCELRDHGRYGVEAQFYMNEEFLESRRFDNVAAPERTPRELAIAWAVEERKALEQS